MLAICWSAAVETNTAVPTMPMIPSTTATGARVIIRAVSSTTNPAKPANDAMVPLRLTPGSHRHAAARARVLEPRTPQLDERGQHELERPDRADPVDVFERNRDDRVGHLAGRERLDRGVEQVPEQDQSEYD